MKRLILLFVVFFITIFAYSQDITGEEVKGVGTVLLENWAIVIAALLAFIKVIIRKILGLYRVLHGVYIIIDNQGFIAFILQHLFLDTL